MRPLRVPASRFRVVRELGRGGMGAVDLVWDALRGEEVARKRCAVRPGVGDDSHARRALARLKREFRAVAELHHPALVTPLELGEDDEGLYFTMEAVDGVDLYAYCRGAPSREVTTEAATETRASGPQPIGLADTLASGGSHPPPTDRRRASTGTRCRYDRLAAVLPPILEGLAHLHARGLVHRDLKPGNVLVDRDGRARILDFGILAELTATTETAGTPAYMAPEQIRGAPPTPAIDLYALGVTLYELVAGEPPFAAPTAVGLFGQHLTAAPPPLAERAADAPPALAEAVMALLAKDPAARPTLAALARDLLPALGAPVPALEQVSLVAGDLVGRELLQLRVASFLERSTRFGALVLEGPSGVGKSALARWAGDRATSAGWAVLSGRARPTELLPFNAVDGIVDALDRALGAAQADAGLEDLRARASIAFPALGAGLAEGDEEGLRQVAFDAVAQLLTRVATPRAGVLLVLDDLQWADADSLGFLSALTSAAPGRVKVLATARDDLPTQAVFTWIDRQPGWEREVVPVLGVDSLALIASRSAGDALDLAAARRVAESCGGRAYLAEVAGRLCLEGGDAPEALAPALAARLDGLPLEARALLAALAAADGWLRAGELADALDVSVGAIDGTARALAALAIVRRAGPRGRDEQLDLYHDVARAAALESMGEGGLRAGHVALADMLARRPDADPLRLVRHLAGAGRADQAAHRAEAEARRAERRRAYGLAAQLYALAAEGAPDRALDLGRARAVALIRGGQYDDAVAQIERLEAPDGPTRAALAFDRGYALAMGGRVREGISALDDSLRMSGVRRLARPGFFSILPDAIRLIAGPPRPASARAEATDDATSREQREREAELALLLTWEEPIAGLSWAQRIRQLADRAGRPERGAFADYVLAFVMVSQGATAGDQRLADRFLTSARARAAPVADEPHLVALDRAVLSLMEFRRGRFPAAAEGFWQVVRQLEATGRAQTHTHLLGFSNVCGALLSGERVTELSAALREFEASCPPRMGAMQAHVAVCQCAEAIFTGDRLAYRNARDDMRARREADGEPRFHHMIAEVLGSHGEVFWGDPIEQRARNAAVLYECRSYRPFATYFAGAFAAFSAQVEAAALRAGDPLASARRIAKWAKLARAAPPVFTSGAVRAEAYAAEHAGDPERAIRLLAEAEAMADAIDGAVSRGIARYQRGRRIGGDEGAALIAAARHDVASVGATEHILEEGGAR